MFVSLVNNLWSFLKSPKLLLISLCLGGLILVAANFITAGESIAYYQAYYPVGAKIITFLELDSVYRSWPLLTIGILLCCGFLVRMVEAAFFRQYGHFLMMGSLFLILVGGYLESSLGVRDYLHLEAERFQGVLRQNMRYGLQREVPLPFALRSKDFLIISNGAEGRPLSYKSTIEILFKGERFTKQLELGNPLVLAGYSISQSSYYQNEAGTLCSIVEVSTHPGKYILVIGGIMLLLGSFSLVIPSLRREALVVDGQQSLDP